jgi:hypothetical protein
MYILSVVRSECYIGTWLPVISLCSPWTRCMSRSVVGTVQTCSCATSLWPCRFQALVPTFHARLSAPAHAQVTDFGLARLLTPGEAAPAGNTSNGTVPIRYGCTADHHGRLSCTVRLPAEVQAQWPVTPHVPASYAGQHLQKCCSVADGQKRVMCGHTASHCGRL